MSVKSSVFQGLFLTAFLLPVSGWSAPSRFIVSFKSTGQFQVASVGARKSRALEELGLQQGAKKNPNHRFLGASAQALESLEHLEMMIIEAEPADVAQLKKHPSIDQIEAEVVYALPKFKKFDFKPHGAWNCEVDIPWGIEAVKAPEAWYTTRGEGSRVAVLDTGIDESHPALQSRIESVADFSGRTKDGADQVGHGTHVSGTIAGDGTCLYGVAPDAKILSGKVCDERGCSSTAVVKGIDWAIGEKASVISMSLGGPIATPLQLKATERAEAAGVVVVAASGNDGVKRISYPANYPNVISVGAVEKSGSTYKRAQFSQYGAGLDIVAPGVDVLSAVPQGSGRSSTVTLNLGQGSPEKVTSNSFAGAPEVTAPLTDELVYAGLGKVADFANINVRGKFALILRGEIAFKDKVANALKAGASGVVFFNNAPGMIRGSIGEDGSVQIPVVLIEQTAGLKAKASLDSGNTVTATIVTESTDYAAMDGTSMATPHVSGVVALIRSANPSLTPAQVRDILARSALTGLGSVEEYGAGMVDAAAAVFEAK